MSNINNPDIDPANNYSLVGAINFAFHKMTQSQNGMLPAQVTAYNRITNRASIQLLIDLVTTDGQTVNRPHLVNIPVLILGGGNFCISFPLAAGNLGWVLANDRDISLFLQSYTQCAPNTYRMNNFADGLFIPDVMKGYTIQSGDDDSLVIQSVDGTARVTISDDSIDVIHPTLININAPSISMDLGISTNVFNVNGSIVATGTITP